MADKLKIKFCSKQFTNEKPHVNTNGSKNEKKKTIDPPPVKTTLGNGKTNEQLVIASWNVGGLRNLIAKNIVRDFIFKYQPDIFCVNQTKVDQQIFLKNPIQLHGYNSYWNFCKVSASYSGVAIFSKFPPLSIHEEVDNQNLSKEGRVLTLTFVDFVLIAAYAPNSGQHLQRLNFKVTSFEPALYKYCNNLRSQGKAVILCGDLNTALSYKDTHYSKYTDKSPGFTKTQRENLRKFIARGWVDTFRKIHPEDQKYSWWNIKIDGRQKRIGKRFDYFLVTQNLADAIVQSQVLQEYMSIENSPILMKMNLFKKTEDISKFANFTWVKATKPVDQASQSKKEQQQLK